MRMRSLTYPILCKLPAYPPKNATARLPLGTSSVKLDKELFCFCFCFLPNSFTLPKFVSNTRLSNFSDLTPETLQIYSPVSAKDSTRAHANAHTLCLISHPLHALGIPSGFSSKRINCYRTENGGEDNEWANLILSALPPFRYLYVTFVSCVDLKIPFLYSPRSGLEYHECTRYTRRLHGICGLVWRYQTQTWRHEPSDPCHQSLGCFQSLSRWVQLFARHLPSVDFFKSMIYFTFPKWWGNNDNDGSITLDNASWLSFSCKSFSFFLGSLKVSPDEVSSLVLSEVLVWK